jgi:hypothetical protein
VAPAPRRVWQPKPIYNHSEPPWPSLAYPLTIFVIFGFSVPTDRPLTAMNCHAPFLLRPQTQFTRA